MMTTQVIFKIDINITDISVMITTSLSKWYN